LIVYFEQCFENYRSIANFWAIFYNGTSYVLLWTKKWLGDISGDFFTNSSGVDVMITIFGDFRQFSAQKLAFFSKTNVVIKSLHNLALF
jgi:hypothetical protein